MTPCVGLSSPDGQANRRAYGLCRLRFSRVGAACHPIDLPPGYHTASRAHRVGNGVVVHGPLTRCDRASPGRRDGRQAELCGLAPGLLSGRSSAVVARFAGLALRARPWPGCAGAGLGLLCCARFAGGWRFAPGPSGGPRTGLVVL
jgi:hypothetical protein